MRANTVRVKTKNIGIYLGESWNAKKRGRFTISTSSFQACFGLREARTAQAALNKFFTEYDENRRKGISLKEDIIKNH